MDDDPLPPGAAPDKPLSAAARRALEEAAVRRATAEAAAAAPTELGGRGGADPTRYDDWEINGRAIDFS